MQSVYHEPVLLNEALGALIGNPGGTYLDLTFGGGGHSAAILERLNEKGKLLAFDQDPDAQQNGLNDARFTFIAGNFRHFARFLDFYKIETVDGIFADLGVSSHQFDTAERGFSVRFDAALDMRMNIDSKLSAADILREWSEADLSDLFYRYGEITFSKKLAAKIGRTREENPIVYPHQLKACLSGLCPPKHSAKMLIRCFQALRIAVNDEMGALEEMLRSTPRYIKPGGKLVVISYHSLEDRMVKYFIRSGNMEGKVEKDFYGAVLAPFKATPLSAIKPNEAELELNTRSRSARMRVGTRN
jgi:16S rRNA (cytosine1402-N4)-methyltransferase